MDCVPTLKLSCDKYVSIFEMSTHYLFTSPVNKKCVKISKNALNDNRNVANSRPVYYSSLDPFGQRSHYISIKFPLHKQSENPWVWCSCFNFTVSLILKQLKTPKLLTLLPKVCTRCWTASGLLSAL